MRSTDNEQLRCIYLRSLGTVFFIALLSYRVQFEGLLSSSGIAPAERILPREFPKVHSFILFVSSLPGFRWFDSDAACKCALYVGMILSLFVMSGYKPYIYANSLVFLILAFLYHWLVVVGQQFFSFQWDILLIEVAFVSAVCYCDWPKMVRRKRDLPSSNVGVWPLRLLLFKLMFMSGVVKIQANCPTWLQFTALEYHFATQCLPGPFAWNAHQLNPTFLRCSVFATLLIEIVLPFLLLLPFRDMRIIGAKLQIVLQVLIILTGNYNFFNLLTIILCLPAMEHDAFSRIQFKYSRICRFLVQTVTFIFIFWFAYNAVSIKKVSPLDGETHGVFDLEWVLAKEFMEGFVNVGVSIAFGLAFLFNLISFLRDATTGSFLQFDATARATICSLFIAFISIPFLSLGYQIRNETFQSTLTAIYPSFHHLQKMHLINGYGLFRRMTGVGVNTHLSNEWGWAGRPPSVVARPEIILEGFFDGKWEEINFRWKPGPVHLRPKQVAPHQPRLDWQMWFASLGSYHHNPWLIQLMDKILEGCVPVLNLLDDDRLSLGKKPSQVRALLYEYDFTRINSTWNRRIPEVVFDGNKNILQAPVWKQVLRVPDTYWTRKLVKHYTPAIERNNTSVRTFLKHNGFTKSCKNNI